MYRGVAVGMTAGETNIAVAAGVTKVAAYIARNFDF
jgi:hypothetical protein